MTKYDKATISLVQSVGNFMPKDKLEKCEVDLETLQELINKYYDLVLAYDLACGELAPHSEKTKQELKDYFLGGGNGNNIYIGDGDHHHTRNSRRNDNRKEKRKE